MKRCLFVGPFLALMVALMAAPALASSSGRSMNSDPISLASAGRLLTSPGACAPLALVWADPHLSPPPRIGDPPATRRRATSGPDGPGKKGTTPARSARRSPLSRAALLRGVSYPSWKRVSPGAARISSEIVTFEDGSALQHILFIDGAPEAISRLMAKAPAPPAPDVPWYLLQAPGPCLPIPYPTLAGNPPNWPCCHPDVNPSGTAVVPAPYWAVTAPYLISDPAPHVFNPNYPAANPNHDNMTRYWASPPVFTIHILGSNMAADIFGGALSPPPPAPPVSYTWTQFVGDIQSTIQTLATGNPYADITATAVALPGSPLYATVDTLTPPVPTAWPGVFVFDDRPSIVPPTASQCSSEGASGPTGNGTNDIMFLGTRPLGLTGGLVSMLVDPTTGMIIEADVLFERAFFVASPIVLPSETTAFRHELAHAFGVDHTNLHAGAMAALGPNPVPLAGHLPSASVFTGVLTGSVNTAVPSEYPQTVAGILKLHGPGGPGTGTNMVSLALHPDDQAAMARIYPAGVPSGTKKPLLNDAAMVQGYVRHSNGAGDSIRNVLLLPRTFQGPQNPVAATNGAVSGTARISPSDIVGMLDIVQGSKGSGGYRIIGILPTEEGGSSDPPTDTFELAVEDLGSVGVDLNPPSVNPGTLGEWFHDPILNVTTNLPSIPPGAAPVQYTLRSNDSNFPGAPNGARVGSLAYVAGTVLNINLQPPGGIEKVTRPLIRLLPRSNPLQQNPPPPTPTLTLDVFHNYALNKVDLMVNGTSFNLDPYGPVQVQPWHTRYVIPVASLPAGSTWTFVATANELREADVDLVFATGENRLVW